MKAFVVRLNPDPRKEPSYSRYPSLREYKEIHKSAPMDGFHEAVNFFPENGLIRGYLPPKHSKSMRTGEPFALVTITAKTAKFKADLIVGIQAGCRYEGERLRSNVSKELQKLELSWHYSCPATLSLLFGNPIPEARNLVLNPNVKWLRNPTLALTSKSFQRILLEIKHNLSNKKEKEKYKMIASSLKNSPLNDIIPLHSDYDFYLKVAAEMGRGRLLKRIGNRFPTPVMVRSLQYQRDPKVVAYALRKANGLCDDCRKAAPFVRRSDHKPYLEVHHVKTLTDGGSDTIDNVIALCPNCHRKRHFG